MKVHIKSPVIDSIIVGDLFLEDNSVRIKFDAPAYCQRVLNFKEGVVLDKE